MDPGGSMIWAFLSGIWPKIFDKRALVFSHRRTMETLGKIGEKNIPRLVKWSPRYLYWLLGISLSKSASMMALSVPFLGIYLTNSWRKDFQHD
jgi:hypothetical protein